jgi:hypothetical protein
MKTSWSIRRAGWHLTPSVARQRPAEVHKRRAIRRPTLRACRCANGKVAVAFVQVIVFDPSSAVAVDVLRIRVKREGAVPGWEEVVSSR